MSEPASVSTSIAGRYASAVYEIAKEADAVPAIEADIASLDQAITESEDFRALIHSPIYSRDEQGFAVSALAAKMDLSETTSNTLELMANKRRLFVLPQLIAALKDIIATEKNEVAADVVSAQPLSDAQAEKLSAMLAETTGKTVTLKKTVDETLIGGLIVKVGSRMIDTSVRSKLNSLQNAMKEVG
ncbi:MAG: F0F1 ATP synthase subunit delta [Pseudomonadota bacterium]